MRKLALRCKKFREALAVTRKCRIVTEALDRGSEKWNDAVDWAAGLVEHAHDFALCRQVGEGNFGVGLPVQERNARESVENAQCLCDLVSCVCCCSQLLFVVAPATAPPLDQRLAVGGCCRRRA